MSNVQDRAESVLETIGHRRSIRRFSEQQLAEAHLEKILEAGLNAPSAGGRQCVIFAACQNIEVNAKLGRIMRANRHVQMSNGSSHVSLEQPSIADDASIRNAFYDAPCVVTLFAPKNFLFSKEDCALAAMNMMLMADTLGVGSCYIGEGWTAFADPYGQQVLRNWNVPGTHFAVMQLLLGYPREGDTYPAPKPRKPGRVIRA